MTITQDTMTTHTDPAECGILPLTVNISARLTPQRRDDTDNDKTANPGELFGFLRREP